LISEEQVQRRLKRFEEVNQKLADPETLKDIDKYQELSKERAYLDEFRQKYNQYIRVLDELEEYKAYVNSGDDELKEMAQQEIPKLEERLKRHERELTTLLVPPDPADENHVIMEIRAGTGGDEASLFAGDLFRMYSKFADLRNWKINIIEETPTDLGGFKEIVFKVKGKGAYGTLKYEGGVHRVQRVPSTESGGRIHTSSASVVVLPEITRNIEIKINPDDLRIDVFRASGAGGQHVNRTESAVRITHNPSGIVVTCQNERSQRQNKQQAMDVLKAKLYERERKKREGSKSNKRMSLIGTGDRSEKIRTYNFPQSRITDHRVGYTSYNLDAFIEGQIDELIEMLKEAYIKERLQEK